MTAGRTRRLRPPAVSIAKFVPDRSQALHDGLATAEDALENVFGVLIWCQVQALGRYTVEARQFVFFVIGRARPVDDMLADGLQ
ncbi:hypothetical protein PPNSA23_40180 [Phyllobacterium phragmitis]|uniref:Uncharacterized protein n=1 Tax=Phyllobacterium phragmitis TaxID=2670329 RepID=A0ABQ0H572_9HYPH